MMFVPIPAQLLDPLYGTIIHASLASDYTCSKFGAESIYSTSCYMCA